MRASIVRILVSPHFCYPLRLPPAGRDGRAAFRPGAGVAAELFPLVRACPTRNCSTLAQGGQAEQREASCASRSAACSRTRRSAASRWSSSGSGCGYRDFLEQESVNRQVFPDLRRCAEAGDVRGADALGHLPDSERPADHRTAAQRCDVRQQAAGQHYGLPFTRPGGRVGAGRRACRSRAAAACWAWRCS